MPPSVDQGPARFKARDLLVVVGTVFLAVGLLVSAVQKVRNRAGRSYCENNLRQLGISCQTLNDICRQLPPVSGPFQEPKLLGRPAPPPVDATLHWWILPFVEGDIGGRKLTYALPDPTTRGVTTELITTFVCRNDPSGSPAVFGTTSYAGNRLVFGTGGPADVPARFPHTFQDGTTNTILFVERYQNCQGVPCLWAANSTFGEDPAPKAAQRPAIGISPWVAPGSPPPEGPTMFMITPQYRAGSAGPAVCVPGGAQTAHREVMYVGMADGSVRPLGPGANRLMSSGDMPLHTGEPPVNNQTIFNALLTPAGRERIPEL